jgi:hypothetical protein
VPHDFRIGKSFLSRVLALGRTPRAEPRNNHRAILGDRLDRTALAPVRAWAEVLGAPAR